MTELELNEQSPHLIQIAKPNLGNPSFLEIDPKLKKTKFIAKLLMVSELTNSKQIEDKILNNINLIPILDYKLELKFLLEKKKQQEKLKRKELKKASKKKRGFWARVLRWKKRKKLSPEDLERLSLEGDQIAQEIEGMRDNLEKLQPRIYRGERIQTKVISIEAVTPLEIHNMAYIHEQERPQSYLIKNRAFGTAYFYYRVTIEFVITEEIRGFLKFRNFVMFDILLDDVINHHSLVITKQDGENLNIIHATDLHIAERNDRIFGIVKNWTESKLKRGIDEIIKNVKKAKKREEKVVRPLRKRLVNPNNQFRKFIKIANRMVLENKLDFIVLTGDLIDFTLLSRFSIKEMKKFWNFKYEVSNWKIFNDILLNKPTSEKLKGVIKGQEILCPIFTIPGNHDYRPYAYDLTWAGMYKKMGLNSLEAAAINDILKIPLSPSAITKTPLALRGYIVEINASHDYYFKIGKNIFIFLDTGSDSFKNIRDLLAGHPSLTGLLPKQIGFLENIINYKYSKGDNIFLFLHGPPINTGEKRSLFKRIQKWFGKPIKTQIEEFRESLSKLGKNARIDGKFNVKYGTVSRNWEKLIKFCMDFCTLTLAGHTHKLREYKLKHPEETTRVFDAPPFSLKKIENPAAVYYDIYSEIHTKAKEIEENSPFVVQTPALGLGGYRNPKLAGAYRVVNIEKSKLASFRIEYLGR